jgi:Uma2 family endonuclease
MMPMVAEITPPPLTVEEYLALEDTALEKHEYVNGRLYAMAGGSNAHDRVGNNCRSLINMHLGEGPCQLHGPDIRLRANEQTYYYPDAFVTCDQNVAPTISSLGDAKLVVEVLSPSTETADRGEKFANYQTLISIEEYVLIDSRHRLVEKFKRVGDGSWLYRLYRTGDILIFDSIGLEVPVAALYTASGL